MTAPKRGPNERATKRALGALRRADRFPEIGGALAALAITTARLTDDAVADPDEKQYAKAKVVTAHLGVLVAWAGMVGNATDRSFDQLLAELSRPTLPDDGRWQ